MLLTASHSIFISRSNEIRIYVSHFLNFSPHDDEPQDNPFFDMLYCNKSETDMIKWKSKYKQKTFEVSASDEFSKRSEILTKKVSLQIIIL